MAEASLTNPPHARAILTSKSNYSYILTILNSFLTFYQIQLMEAGDPGKPGDPAALHVVEEQKSEFDPVTVHSPKMVVKTAQDQPQKVLAATQTHVLLMEAGAPGAPMDPAVKHVAEEQERKVDPVTVHSHNMEVKPALDHPHIV